MPYQLPAPSTLDDIFKMNPGAFTQAQQFMQGGVDQNNQDLQASQIRNMFDQQMNPERLRAQQLGNQTTEFQLPGIQANSEMMQRKNSNEGLLNDDSLKAAHQKFASAATQAHLDELEAKGQEMAFSDDPVIAAQGQKILLAHKDIVRDRAKQDEMAKRQVALEQVRGKNALELAGVNNAAGRFQKRGGATAQDNLEKALVSGTWDKAATAYDHMAQMASEDGDDERAQFYQQKAKEYADKYVASRNAPKAGTVDVSGIPGANIPTQPTPTTVAPTLPPNRIQQDLVNGATFSSPEVEAQVRAKAGTSRSTSLPPAAEDWIKRAMSANPGMSREQVIEQGKKKGKF